MKKLLLLGLMFCAVDVGAENMEVVGRVESKCVITPDTSGFYGNPTPQKLDSDPTSGGVDPVVRYDVLQANFYKAKISYPIAWSESPTLSDTVTWVGDVETSEVSVAGMSAYNAAKVEYDNHTEFNLTLAGSTWFKTETNATYGVGKAFPAGNYRAVVVAECIAP